MCPSHTPPSLQPIGMPGWNETVPIPSGTIVVLPVDPSLHTSGGEGEVGRARRKNRDKTNVLHYCTDQCYTVVCPQNHA